MTTDSAFIASADATLSAIGAALDAALADDRNEADSGTDWSLRDGILEIECSDGSKLIVNRHVPNREIWVAARSGGFHFRADGGVWRDMRSGKELAAEFTRLLREQAGLTVDLTRLPGPAIVANPATRPITPSSPPAPGAAPHVRASATRRSPRSAGSG